MEAQVIAILSPPHKTSNSPWTRHRCGNPGTRGWGGSSPCTPEMETDCTGGPGRPHSDLAAPLGGQHAHRPWGRRVRTPQGARPALSMWVASQEAHLDLRGLRFSSHWCPRRSPTGGCAHLQSQGWWPRLTGARGGARSS